MIQTADGDGIGNACDICTGGDDTVDSDADAVPDACDNAPNVPNPTPAEPGNNA
jgi:hypothetical protein